MTPAPAPAALLDGWIARSASPAGRDWLAAALAAVAADPARLAATLSLAQRRLGRAPLPLGPADLAAAAGARPGWDPSGWTLGEAGRVRLLLAAPAEGFAARLRAVLAAADLGEGVAVYKGLPLYPGPEALVPVATEGLRTAVRPLFEAVAHANPFPADHFPRDPWNHMILKALFIGSGLAPVVGLDRRWTPELAAILLDYARERRAAGRAVPPDLWRGVGRHGGAAALDDLAVALAGEAGPERRAAALALAEAGTAEAGRVLDRAPDLAAAARAGRLTWDALDRDAPDGDVPDGNAPAAARASG